MNCKTCGGKSVKNGKTASGKQRYCCKVCTKQFQSNYTYNAYYSSINEWIIKYIKEGLGLRSIARLLKISAQTVISRIKHISRNLKAPIIPLNKTFQIDEVVTYIQNKPNRFYVVLALCEESKVIVSIAVGKRNNYTLKQVVNSVLLAQPKKVKTDRLKNYLSLVPKPLHSTKRRGINHIERTNLTLRTHLKRLQRRTICFSKSLIMLLACVRIYFWS